MPRFACLLAAAAVLLSAAAASAADWTLTTPDFSQSRDLTVNTWTPADGLSVTAANGKLLKIPTRDALLLDSGRKPNPSAFPSNWRLRLRNGDVVYGEPASMSGQSITLQTPDLDNVSLPLKSVAQLSLTDEKAVTAPSGADHDVVYLTGGDLRQGIVTGISPTEVQLATGADNTLLPIKLNLVRSIVFGGVAAPRAVPPLSARISLLSGTILTVPLDKPDSFAWSIPGITFADPAGGTPHKLGADRIVSVEILGGRLVFLSDIDPARDEQSTFTGAVYPTRDNLNVMGGPLRAAGVTYPRGLGVHTHSVLTYTLDGTFDTFTFRPAIDDSAAPNGEADLAVVLDGKTVWQSQKLKPLGPRDTAPQAVTIPLKGAHSLELHADSADHLDVLGRVDWIDAALLRP